MATDSDIGTVEVPYRRLSRGADTHYEDGLEVDDVVVVKAQSFSDRILEAGSIRASVFELVSATLGAGCLALPYAVTLCGVVEAIALLIFGAVFAVYTMWMLTVVRDLNPPHDSYETLVRYLLGPAMEIFVEISIIIFAWGTCVAYTLVIGETLSPIAVDQFGDQWWTSENFIMLFFTTVVLLPLASLKNISSLRFTCFLSVLVLGYLFTAIAIRTGQRIADKGLEIGQIKFFDFSYRIFLAIPLILFAFSSHINIFSIYHELARPSDRRILRVILFACTLSFLLYFFISMTGYADFRQDTKPNILNNYETDDWLLQAGSVAITVVIMLNYPLSTHPCRITINHMINSNKFLATKIPHVVRYWVITLGMVYLALLVAIFIPGIDVAFGFLGATATAVVCFIMPGIMYFKGGPYAGQWGHRANIMALGVAALGAILGIIGVTAELYEVVWGSDKDGSRDDRDSSH